MDKPRLTDEQVQMLLQEIASCFPGNEAHALELLKSRYEFPTQKIKLSGEELEDLTDFHSKHRIAFERRKKFGTPHALKILEGSLQTSPRRPYQRQVSEKPNLDRYDNSGSFTKRFS